MSSLSESTFQEFDKPLAVGMASTEGEKLLNALRKIQFKLKDSPQKSGQKSAIFGHNSTKSGVKEEEPKGCTLCSSGDHHLRAYHKTDKCRQSVVGSHRKTSEELIETRLKLIETQLKDISMQLKASSSSDGLKSQTIGHKLNDKTSAAEKTNSAAVEKSHSSANLRDSRRVSPPKTKMKFSFKNDVFGGNDLYETSINAIKQLVRSADNQKISKSVSLDAINHRFIPSKHFHLQYRDIPFILGTNVRHKSRVGLRGDPGDKTGAKTPILF